MGERKGKITNMVGVGVTLGRSPEESQRSLIDDVQGGKCGELDVFLGKRWSC